MGKHFSGVAFCPPAGFVLSPWQHTPHSSLLFTVRRQSARVSFAQDEQSVSPQGACGERGLASIFASDAVEERTKGENMMDSYTARFAFVSKHPVMIFFIITFLIGSIAATSLFFTKSL